MQDRRHPANDLLIRRSAKPSRTNPLKPQWVGQADVDVEEPVPGERLVRADGVVLDPVVLGVRDQVRGVGDLLKEQLLVLQRAEPALA